MNSTTLAVIERNAPSVFATEPFGGMSDKYKFIPTIDVVERLLDEGFVLSKVAENRVRLASKEGYARHMLRFRHGDLAPQVGDLIPEIVLTNSHDGTSAFQMSAGLYRLVCANGMTAGGDQYRIRQRHAGDVHDVIDGVFKVVEELPQVMDEAMSWNGIELNAGEQIAYARAALPLRWDVDEHGNAPVNPSHLLRTRRWGDKGDDLFTTFNKVQEAVIKGGVSAMGSTGKRRASKAVNSVGEDQRLNKALWTLTQEFAKLKLAA